MQNRFLLLWLWDIWWQVRGVCCSPLLLRCSILRWRDKKRIFQQKRELCSLQSFSRHFIPVIQYIITGFENIVQYCIASNVPIHFETIYICYGHACWAGVVIHHCKQGSFSFVWRKSFLVFFFAWFCLLWWVSFESVHTAVGNLKHLHSFLIALFFGWCGVLIAAM